MKNKQKLSVAIGCFDGVHIGHAEVISNAVAVKSDGESAAVVTFENGMPKLIPQNEKKELIYSLGVDEIIEFKLSEIKDLSPEQFIRDILRSRLNVSRISVGFNFRFGRNASGDIRMLEGLCRRTGIELTVIPQIKSDGKTVSSSAIRDMLTAGNVSGAAKMLGRNFAYTSEIVHGDGRGEKTLGIPTLNQNSNPEIFVPRFGVYRSQMSVKGEIYPGITNVGVRPTVSGKNINYETHLFDVKEEFYGEIARVELLEFIRGEKKFETLSELKTRMEADIATVKRKNSLHLK